MGSGKCCVSLYTGLKEFGVVYNPSVAESINVRCLLSSFKAHAASILRETSCIWEIKRTDLRRHIQSFQLYVCLFALGKLFGVVLHAWLQLPK